MPVLVHLAQDGALRLSRAERLYPQWLAWVGLAACLFLAFWVERQIWLVGLALILAGFLLMLGPDANTVDGKLDPNAWNEDIFSIRRIRLAPLLVISGFVVQVFAILKRNK